MTEFELKHGLSQDEPGPLGLEAPDDTLARTGNTARDQEMYAAGIRTGEENTKHNAAIRAGVPDGWKLVPIEPTDEMEAAAENDYEQRGETFPDWKAKYRAMLSAAPASPVSTVEDERQAFEAWFTQHDETKDIAERAVRRSPSGAYVLMQTYTAWEVWQAALAMRPAPAAGDAQDLTLAQKYEDACILANANARDAALWRAYAAQFPEVSAAFLAMHGGDVLPTIKGAAITGGYVVVTPAGRDADKAAKLRDAILRLFPINPTYTPPTEDYAAQRQGDA